MDTLLVAKRTFGNAYDVHLPGIDASTMLVEDGVATPAGGGEPLGRLVENFWNTRARFLDADDGEVGHLEFAFPLIPRGKRFTLVIGERRFASSYQPLDAVHGGISSGGFRCADERGVILEIEKELALDHRFTVRFAPELTATVAALAAIAVDRRFYQLR